MSTKTKTTTTTTTTVKATFRSKWWSRKHSSAARYPTPTNIRTFLLEQETRYNLQRTKQRVWQFVYWRKNLFLLPTGETGESFINEITRIINAWVYDTSIKGIPLKALHAMPAFLLQKPSKNSKSNDHLKSLERRFKIWKEVI